VAYPGAPVTRPQVPANLGGDDYLAPIVAATRDISVQVSCTWGAGLGGWAGRVQHGSKAL